MSGCFLIICFITVLKICCIHCRKNRRAFEIVEKLPNNNNQILYNLIIIQKLFSLTKFDWFSLIADGLINPVNIVANFSKHSIKSRLKYRVDYNNRYIFTWMLHQIFIYFDKVIPIQPIHSLYCKPFLPTVWMNWPINEVNFEQRNWRQIFPCQYIHVLYIHWYMVNYNHKSIILNKGKIKK